MVKLCIFDLDQTLIATDDMKALREAGLERADSAYETEVRAALDARYRHLVTERQLQGLLSTIPTLKIAVLSRSPRRYVDIVLRAAYPETNWDAVIGFEDVAHVKPHREGIYKIMRAAGLPHVSDLPDVVVVGDIDIDIRAAYHAGCNAILFRAGWPQSYEGHHWRAPDLLPDADANRWAAVLNGLSNPISALPDLECLLADPTLAPEQPRFVSVGKFFPNERSRHLVHAAGRSFAQYETLSRRRTWHLLSQSISANKDSVVFPDAWVATAKRFINHHYQAISSYPFDSELVICVVPARPGRLARLDHFLAQLRDSYGGHERIGNMRLTFDASVLKYEDGVRSQSRDHLNREERFENVRLHLRVADPAAARGKRFLVIDDVSTTGATLLYAEKYLRGAGAADAACFTFALNISNPL